jgi:WD40 repeat protein
MTSTSAPTTTPPVNPGAGDGALQRTNSITSVTASLLSPDGQLFAAAGRDGQVYLWNVSVPGAPKLLDTLAGPTTAIIRLALSPDGRELAVATAAGHVWLFSVAIPARASLLATLTAARGKLTALAFSPSDDTLAAGSAKRRLTFWHFRPYQAVNRICALAGTPITANEWARYVPQVPYNPPCAKWTPPAPPLLTGRASG